MECLSILDYLSSIPSDGMLQHLSKVVNRSTDPSIEYHSNWDLQILLFFMAYKLNIYETTSTIQCDLFGREEIHPPGDTDVCIS